MAQLGGRPGEFHGAAAPVGTAVGDRAVLGQTGLDPESVAEGGAIAIVAVVEDAEALQYRQRVVEIDAAAVSLDDVAGQLIVTADEGVLPPVFGDELDGLGDGHEGRRCAPVGAILDEDCIVVRRRRDGGLDVGIDGGAVAIWAHGELPAEKGGDGGFAHREGDRRLRRVGIADVARPAEEGVAGIRRGRGGYRGPRQCPLRRDAHRAIRAGHHGLVFNISVAVDPYDGGGRGRGCQRTASGSDELLRHEVVNSGDTISDGRQVAGRKRGAVEIDLGGVEAHPHPVTVHATGVVDVEEEDRVVKRVGCLRHRGGVGGAVERDRLVAAVEGVPRSGRHGRRFRAVTGPVETVLGLHAEDSAGQLIGGIGRAARAKHAARRRIHRRRRQYDLHARGCRAGADAGVDIRRAVRLDVFDQLNIAIGAERRRADHCQTELLHLMYPCRCQSPVLTPVPLERPAHRAAGHAGAHAAPRNAAKTRIIETVFYREYVPQSTWRW